jgi:DNA-binding transcriptional MerR regulator
MIKKTRTTYVSAAEIVKKYGVTYQAVNHYTNLGLLQVVVKDGNMRMYAKTKVKDRLSKISKLVNEGYSLRLIRKKLIGV